MVNMNPLPKWAHSVLGKTRTHTDKLQYDSIQVIKALSRMEGT